MRYAKKHGRHLGTLSILTAVSLLFGSIFGAWFMPAEKVQADSASPTDPVWFMKAGPQATSLTVLDVDVSEPTLNRTTTGDSVQAAAIDKMIQGIVNRTSANKIYLERDCYDTHNMAGPWWNFQEDMRKDIPELSNLPVTTLQADGTDDGALKCLLENYGSFIKGFVVYDPNSTNGVDAATYAAAITISGLDDAIPVSPDMMSKIQGWGYNFPILVDLRTQSFQHDYDVLNWMVANYWPQTNQSQKVVFVIMSPMTLANESAIDYIAATQSFAYSCQVSGNTSVPNGDAALMGLLHKYTEGDVAIVGWGNQAGGGEVPAVTNGTSYFDIGQEGASNFSVWSSFPDSSATLPTPTASTVSNNDVFIAFALTDGDTLHCDTIGLFSEYTRLKESHWGTVPVSFGVNPVLTDYASPIYKFLVNNLPAGSDLFDEGADKDFQTKNTNSATVNKDYINAYANYGGLTFAHTNGGYTMGGADSPFLGIWVGFANTQVDAAQADFNTSKMIVGDWFFTGGAPRMADIADYQDVAGNGIRSYVSTKTGPVFMVVNLGWEGARQTDESSYIAASNIAANLEANSAGRTYHFVGTSDLAATYDKWAASGGTSNIYIPYGSERVQNGGFESNPTDGSGGWQTYNWGGTGLSGTGSPAFTWTTDATHSGTYSVKISGASMVNDNYTQNSIMVSPSTQMEFSGWIKTDSFNSTGYKGVRFAIQELDSMGNTIPTNQGGYHENTALSGTTDWTHITIPFTTNANTRKVFIRCLAGGTGTAWFDDVSLINGVGTPDTDATLNDLQVDGTTVSGFSASQTDYDVVLPAGTTAIPNVTGTVTDTGKASIISIVPPASLPGSTVVTVKAQDGATTKVYTVHFTVAAPSSDATLNDLSVNGTTVSGFSPDQTDYTVVLPAGATAIPNVTATPSDANALANVVQATALPGDATVTVTAQDATTKTYTVHLTVAAPSSDATLSDLAVNGTTMSGFSPDQTDYTVVLPAGATAIPNVTAIPSDANALASITQAAALPGNATVTVTAQDATTKTYAVHFTVAAAGKGSSGGGGSGGSSSPTPVTVTGTTTQNGDGTSSTTATITSGNTDTTTVSTVTVQLGDVSVQAPATVLESALGSDSTASLSLSQSASPASTQQSAFQLVATGGGTPVASLDLNLTRVAADGTATEVHQLSDSVTVTLRLTAAQIAALGGSTPVIYYYDTGVSPAVLTDMHAVYDAAAGTLSFTTAHFSTYVVAAAASASSYTPGVSYTAHVQRIGWQKAVGDGAEAGTEHQALRAEGVQIKLTGSLPAGASIVYQAHVQHYGWMAPVSDNALAGTTGRSLRLEALRITLKGLTGYEVQYRAYVPNKGWLNWVTTVNGADIAQAAVAGTTGKCLRVEALEIKLVKVS